MTDHLRPWAGRLSSEAHGRGTPAQPRRVLGRAGDPVDHAHRSCISWAALLARPYLGANNYDAETGAGCGVPDSESFYHWGGLLGLAALEERSW